MRIAGKAQSLPEKSGLSWHPREDDSAAEAVVDLEVGGEKKWIGRNLSGENHRLLFGRCEWLVGFMSLKTKKRFGVWMDNHHATVVGHENPEATDFTVIGHAKNPGPGGNSNENAANNLEKTLLQKYFREIGSFMENAAEVHITGTGTIQEQFIHYLAETPQFKNTITAESTSNKMSDEKLVEFVTAKFN